MAKAKAKSRSRGGGLDDVTARVLVTAERHKTARAVVPWLVVAYLGYCFLGSIKALSGKATIFEAFLVLNHEIRLSEKLSWAANVVLLLAWRRTFVAKRKLHQEKDRRLSDLERAHDPHRSSSGLDKLGDNRPEDIA